MARRRHVVATVALLLGLLPAAACAAQYKVMIATWRGCEEACRGVQEILAGSGHEIEILLRDAAGNRARLRDFLAEARAAKVDAIVTWGSSVSLGIAGTLAQRDDPALNHDIPQVFMIVADPERSGLVESLDRPGRRNLTGTFNRVPESVNIDTIRAYLPEFRHLGLLYNRNEPNSVIKRDEMAELAPSLGYRFTALELPLGANGRPRVEDIPVRLGELKAAGVDFVYLGSSSFLRAHGAVLGRAAREAELPLLSPYEEIVREGGALLSVAARYFDVGRLAGRQTLRMLTGPVPPEGLPVLQMTEFAVVINLATARAIGAYPPIDLLQVAETVD
ncbi:ABC transporter substrate-binding protein [Falsiroseomonas sp.]|uniref:ABC transporter substrate-binding protein n=1 Tax=Falsiroseomonas sp. TaxID=2870721 RepID=UPI00356613D0